MKDSLSPVALSRLTWTADDRRAWDDTYRASLWCAVKRDERDGDARAALVHVHPVFAALSPGARSVIADTARYSVHVDNYGKGQS